MNDILRWAKEADLWMTSDERIAAVERFAALVRADEREACAKLVEHYRSDWDMAETIRARGQEA